MVDAGEYMIHDGDNDGCAADNDGCMVHEQHQPTNSEDGPVRLEPTENWSTWTERNHGTKPQSDPPHSC